MKNIPMSRLASYHQCEVCGHPGQFEELPNGQEMILCKKHLKETKRYWKETHKY